MKFGYRHISRMTLAVMTSALVAGMAICASGQEKPAAPSPAAAAPAAKSAADAGSKVVLRVGKDEITEASMKSLISGLSPQSQESISKEGPRAVGEQLAVMLVLDQQAEKDNLDSNPEIRERLELEKRQLLARAEYQKLANEVKVTPDEISQYFDAHKDIFDEVKICEVVVRKKGADAKAGDPGLPPAQALAKVNAIRAALTSGADITKVKKEFSVPNVVVIDADPRVVRHGQLLPELDKEAFSLKDGQVSKPYQAPEAVVMFQVVSHEPATLKGATSQIETDLRRTKLNDEINGMKKSANVWMDEDYFKAPPAPEEPAAKEAAPEKPSSPAAPKH